ncbi:MAG: class I SAM-dependent methyltransferase [Frankiaceae bacterium]|nr:class I SAM-dependent methyltransferase [Frankiaceae bacterium]
MSTHAQRARSFGAIADEYDRLRPSPGAAAVDWLVPDGCQVAVDVAAGTGKMTRALTERVPTVIAVEPDERMRAVLADRSPTVRVLDGTGEQIPLPDGSADALFVASAWHWLDPDHALPEIARVLRDGGRLGVLWTSRDRDIEWVRDLDRGPDDPPWDGASEGQHRARRAEGLADARGYQKPETASFGFTRRMTLEDVVEMVATYSAVITAEPAVRNRLLDVARDRLQRRFPGETEIDLPMRTWCWRAERIPR